MAKRPLRAALAMVFGILITIGGCAEHPSTLSEGAQLKQVRLGTPTMAPSFSRGGSDVVSQTIGSEGGTLSIPGGHTLTFPAGALSQPTEITARPGRVFVEVEFGPHGLQFPAGHEPVLTLSYAGALNLREVSSLSIVYMQGTRITEMLGGRVDADGKTVSAQVGHFSKYAMVSN